MNNWKRVLKNRFNIICLFIVGLALPCQLLAQQDRFQIIEQRLKDLSSQVPGLNQKTDLSVSNSSLQEFLRGLAAANNINLNIDPSLIQKISNNFSDEKVINILLFLARQYNLDINFIGSIISITPFRDPLANQAPAPKPLNITYNTFSQNITMDLQDDSLSNIAKRITQLTNRNIVVLPELYNRKITEYIQDMPVQSALEKIAFTHNFKLNLTNDDVIVLEPLRQDEEIVTKQQSLPNANFSIHKVNRNPNQPGSSSIEVTEENGRKTVTLNVTNTPIKDVIKNIAEQANINYFVYTEIIGNATANVKNMEFERVLGLILQGTKYTYSVDKDVYMVGDKNYEGLRTKRLIQLRYRSVDSLLPVIPQELKEGVEIKEFKELNGILLTGSEPQIKEIEAFLKQIDKVVPLITLDVIILDVNKGRTVTTGITAGTSDSVRPGGTIMGAGGLNYTFGSQDINQFLNNIGLNNVFNLGHVTPNFYVNISALENNSNVNQRQTPKLSTLNGHVANLSIGNTQYYSVTTQNVVGSLSPQTVVTQQFIPVEANLAIDIIPFVSGDDDVTLTISVNISNFTANTPINQPPPTSTSKYKSIIRVRNEEMVLLGGIERTIKSETASGIPFLARIPVLKWLFSSHSKSNTKVVSIVFIKPTIIYQ
jgi:type IV pilus assembly protein PilQ